MVRSGHHFCQRQTPVFFRYEASVVSSRKIGKWWQQTIISGLLTEEPNTGELIKSITLFLSIYQTCSACLRYICDWMPCARVWTQSKWRRHGIDPCDFLVETRGYNVDGVFPARRPLVRRTAVRPGTLSLPRPPPPPTGLSAPRRQGTTPPIRPQRQLKVPILFQQSKP